MDISDQELIDEVEQRGLLDYFDDFDLIEAIGEDSFNGLLDEYYGDVIHLMEKLLERYSTRLKEKDILINAFNKILGQEKFWHGR